jgi:hypothetical protein
MSDSTKDTKQTLTLMDIINAYTIENNLLKNKNKILDNHLLIYKNKNADFVKYFNQQTILFVILFFLIGYLMSSIKSV